jgi:ABC-2 type transport system ATP-binding protein
MAQPAIRISGLVKTYGTKRAVDGLSFEVCAGEIFALLGPNGAGKTTTVEILEGYRKPDSGRVQVLGCDPIADAARLKPRIGAMLQEGGLYPAITPREALDLFAHFYRHPRDTDELLRLTGLEDSAATRYRRLSGGQKQRLALALALIGRPQLVFLDEPTAGVDPQARRATWDIISRLQDENVTVLLTTHYLEEAERLADRVGIMDEGKLVALGSPESLVRSDASIVRLRTESSVPLEAIGALPAACAVRQDGAGTYIVETDDAPTLLVEVTSWLRQEGVLATELRVGQGSLEEVFLRLTGKELE